MTRTAGTEHLRSLLTLTLAASLSVGAEVAADPLPSVGAWVPNGVRIASTSGRDFEPQAASDGSGGAFVKWTTVTAPSVIELRLTHVLANGQLDSRWPEGGLRLGPSDTGQLLEDGSGGAYLARWISGQVTVTRYQQDGSVSPAWTPGGPLQIGTHFGNFAVTDSGELWHVHWSFNWLTVCRIKPDGTFVDAWSPPGKQLAKRGEQHSWVTVGRAGGVSVLTRLSPFGSLYDFEVSYWEVESDGSFTSTFLGYGYQFGFRLRIAKDAAGRRFTGLGTWAGGAFVQQPSLPRSWPGMQVALNSSPPHDFIDLVPDDQGGVFVQWERAGIPSELRFGHVRSSGLLDDRWPLPESTFVSSADLSKSAAIMPDGDGGLFVHRWLEPGGGTQGVLQRVREDGSWHSSWPAGGAAFRQGPGSAAALSATIDRVNGLFLLWSDDRTGQSDLYAQRISPSSLPVATAVEMARGEWVRGQVSLRWRLSEQGARDWRVERSVDGFEWSSVGEARLAAEARTWDYTDVTPVVGRTNHYRLTDAARAEIIGEVGVWVPGATKLAARLQTGSADGVPSVVVTGARPGALRAQLRDIQGRVVDTRTLTSNGEASLTLNWSARQGVASGMYWVVVTQDDAQATARLIVLR